MGNQVRTCQESVTPNPSQQPQQRGEELWERPNPALGRVRGWAPGTGYRGDRRLPTGAAPRRGLLRRAGWGPRGSGKSAARHRACRLDLGDWGTHGNGEKETALGGTCTQETQKVHEKKSKLKGVE